MEIMISLNRNEADKIRTAVNEIADKELITFDSKNANNGLLKFRSGFIVRSRYVAVLQINHEFISEIVDLYKDNTENIRKIFNGAKALTEGLVKMFVDFTSRGTEIACKYLDKKKENKAA